MTDRLNAATLTDLLIDGYGYDPDEVANGALITDDDDGNGVTLRYADLDKLDRDDLGELVYDTIREFVEDREQVTLSVDYDSLTLIVRYPEATGLHHETGPVLPVLVFEVSILADLGESAATAIPGGFVVTALAEGSDAFSEMVGDLPIGEGTGAFTLTLDGKTGRIVFTSPRIAEIFSSDS